MNRILADYAGRGLAVLAVNFGDKAETVADYFRKEGFKMIPVRQEKDEVTRAFGVRVYPTLYLIDREGTVAWSSAGYDEEILLAGLERVAPRK